MQNQHQPSRRQFMKKIGLAGSTAFATHLTLPRPTRTKNALQSAKALSEPNIHAVDTIEPMIGTGLYGHTFPGAMVPFGLVQLSPDTCGGGAEPRIIGVGRSDTDMYGWAHCSGYHYPDNVIIGFTHTHISGSGSGELTDILLVPTVGSIQLDPGTFGNGYVSRFSHHEEVSKAGSYSVFLADPEVQVELTATTRCGFHKYVFPSTTDAHCILDLVHGGSVYAAEITIENDHTISGFRKTHGWAPDRSCYFVMIFSRPFKSCGVRLDGHMLPPGMHHARGVLINAHFDFDATRNRDVMVKVGISGTSVAGARRNLAAEIPHWNFSATRGAARAAWRKAISAIQITSSDPMVTQGINTASYHSQIGPTLYCDIDGSYRGQDHKNHTYSGFKKYTTISIWDIFRCQFPMLTILQPQRINDIIKTMLADYRELNQHAMPMWPLWGNETWAMVGYHSAAIVAAAYFRGFRDYDAHAILDALIDTASQDRNDQGEYRRFGYVVSGPHKQSVSKTLDYAWDDWCVGQLAKALGRDHEAQLFLKRSANWRNVFDPATGFMRGRLQNGHWRKPFIPEAEIWDDYTESNAWQASWWVPHDMAGLIKLHGGDGKFVAMLDRLFTNTKPIINWDVDITGLIGQCAQGNEPSNHIPYLYVFAGAPWKTQYYVRLFMDRFYGNQPQSLPGNDDIGQLSSWYLAGALGFYPVNPITGIYVLGSPRVDRATIQIPGTKNKFSIIAENNNSENVFIQSVTLNGVDMTRTWISHADLLLGGELHFRMGRKANRDWGSHIADRPPSGFPAATS